jgi:hypothetical protein
MRSGQVDTEHMLSPPSTGEPVPGFRPLNPGYKRGPVKSALEDAPPPRKRGEGAESDAIILFHRNIG